MADKLPKGIEKSDLKYPCNYKDSFYFDKEECKSSFEIWLTEGFGWVIPTLEIQGAGRRSKTRRTYGITLEEKLVSVGRGPHVLETHTVHTSKKNKDRLKKYTDLYSKGMSMAGGYRDRLSTRRLRTRSLRQSLGY